MWEWILLFCEFSLGEMIKNLLITGTDWKNLTHTRVCCHYLCTVIKMTIYPTFYTAVHPLPQDICYWWSCIGHSTSNCLYNFKLTISFPSGIKKKKNPQPPAKNASFTYSTTHTMSENIAKSDISHQTYRVLYLKLLFLNSMSPSPLIAGLRHKLTEMYCVFWSWY